MLLSHPGVCIGVVEGAEVVPGAAGAVGVEALVAYAAIGITEDGAVGVTMAAVEFLPGTLDDVLGASLTGSGFVRDAVVLKEAFEVKRLEVTGWQWLEELAQQASQHVRTGFEWVGSEVRGTRR